MNKTVSCIYLFINKISFCNSLGFKLCLSEEFPAKFHCNMVPNTEVVEFNIVTNNENLCEEN